MENYNKKWDFLGFNTEKSLTCATLQRVALLLQLPLISGQSKNAHFSPLCELKSHNVMQLACKRLKLHQNAGLLSVGECCLKYSQCNQCYQKGGGCSSGEAARVVARFTSTRLTNMLHMWYAGVLHTILRFAEKYWLERFMSGWLVRSFMANGSQYIAASPLSAKQFVLTCIFIIAKPRAAATSAGSKFRGSQAKKVVWVKYKRNGERDIVAITEFLREIHQRGPASSAYHVHLMSIHHSTCLCSRNSCKNHAPRSPMLV